MARAESVVVASAAEKGAWDDLVLRSPDSTICHDWRWREIMEDVLGHECVYLAVRGGGDALTALLPLVRMRSRIFGQHVISIPFMNDGGPLGEAGARATLATAALERARDWGAESVELRAREEVPGPLATSDRKVTVHLPLPGSREELWKDTFRAKLRSQIRRPMKEGMETRFGADQLLPFYEVFSRNMRDLGTPVLPRPFFERIARLFPAEAVFAATYHEGMPVAAGAGFVWHDEFEITWASSLPEFNRLAPNMLLYASMMEHVIERGVKLFNFGRCTPGGGTHRFKLQWGGSDVPLPWAAWYRAGSGGVPAAERPVFQMAATAWQRMPLSIANRLGPVLARRIPSF